MPAVLFYDVVLSVHIAAIMLAFGVLFAYPILGAFVARNHPRFAPVLHEAQGRIGRVLTTPAATVALVAGLYLAGHRHDMGRVWVIVPLVILITILGLHGALLAGAERRAAELARRDIDTAPAGGAVTWSAEYQAVATRIAKIGGLSSLLVLVAIFFMTAKPFA